MRRPIAGVAVIVTVCSVSAAAQWSKYQAPGVPRDAGRRVRMDAPTPRTPDGKPDLSGNWIRFRGEGAFAAPELSGLEFPGWGAELKKQRMALTDKEKPDANCLPSEDSQRWREHGRFSRI